MLGWVIVLTYILYDYEVKNYESKVNAKKVTIIKIYLYKVKKNNNIYLVSNKKLFLNSISYFKKYSFKNFFFCFERF